MYVQEIKAAPDSPTVVLLHGGGVGGWSWQPVAERLTAYHLLIPDLPGQGRSIDDGPFAFERAAALVASMIRERAHGGLAHVAGLSLGAQTAVQMLAAVPEVMLSAFVSGALVRRLPGAGLVRPTLMLYWPFKNIPFMVRANMWGLGIPARYYGEFAADTRAATVDSLTSILAANMGFGLPAGLAEVRDRPGFPPVLVTVGQREYSIMRRSARDLANVLPTARAYAVRGVGHNWPVSAPDLYTRTLCAWMAAAPLPVELAALQEGTV